jgi:hypothetical protein
MIHAQPIVFPEFIRVWAATVVVNSMIMTLYLWHISVMLIAIFASWMLGANYWCASHL